MFESIHILFGFIMMFVPFLLVLLGMKTGMESTKFQTTMFCIGELASLYCLFAGIFLIQGWQDPFASVTTDRLAHASAQARGRGGIILMIIRYWPYVLSAIGGYMTYNYLDLMTIPYRAKRHVKRQRASVRS